MSVISIFVVALVLANFTGIDGQYDRVVCHNLETDALLAPFFLEDCVDVKHTKCTVCPAHWYVDCPSGYVHKTYKSCGFLGCQLVCVREWKVCPRCDVSCNDCPTPRYIKPTPRPTKEPTKPTPRPTKEPTPRPTFRPTKRPTPEPTGRPTVTPTRPPTRFPTVPTDYPTNSPTDSPTKSPTSSPTEAPSQFPTRLPTPMPTNSTLSPSMSPTSAPIFTNAPTMELSVPSPEQVCAAVSHKAACKVTPGCYFGDKADGPCSLFSGVCENITNRKTCKAAQPCVSRKGRCLSKSFTITNHQ